MLLFLFTFATLELSSYPTARVINSCMVRYDKIIGYFDDELVVKILSFLPTEVAVSTSFLSKQWKFLWTRVTKLDYDDRRIIYNSSEGKRMRRFIVMNLPLYSSPLIESLCLGLRTTTFQPDDIKLLVEIAVTRRVRELIINNCECMEKSHAILQSSLYNCKSLVTLKLKNRILVDVPRVVCLPSLKTLHLIRVKYADEESLQRLLSSCPILEDLVVKLFRGDNVRKFAVSHPTLLNFEIYNIYIHGYAYVINTPSLKYFKKGFRGSSSFFIVNMPKLEKAVLHLNDFSNIKKVLEPFTSVKHLSLCVIFHEREVVYGDDIVFNELEHLKIHIVYNNGTKLLLWLLKCSPKLRDLEFSEIFAQDGIDTSDFLKQLNYVPQCLLSSLQIFKWTCNNPTLEEREMATYILRNSCQLKTAIFRTGSNLDQQKRLEMKKELVLSSCGSTTCNLVFNNFD